MKSFSHFLKEAINSAASQARKLNLQGDGHGNWFDAQGNLKAKTIQGRLKMVSPKEAKKEDQPKQKSVAKQQPEPQQKQKTEPQEQQPQQKQETEPQKQKPIGEFGTFPNGEPRRMPQPTNASGEPKEDLGKIVLTFGRFNPPTIGHQKLLDQARKAAGKDGTLKIYPSRSHDGKKNPLDPSEKVETMRQYYPDHADSIVDDPNVKTIFDALKQAYQDGYSEVEIVVGGDRVSEFDKMSSSYNGKIYDYQNVSTTSAGDRDPDAEGVEGMSASKMREAAKNNDFDTYRSGVPDHIDDKTARQGMNTLRKRMNVGEDLDLWQIAPKLDWKNLRENYVNKVIFNVDQVVESLNTGFIGKIIRRGTNYVICVTESGEMFKSWIHDIGEVYEYGTDEYRRYVQKITPKQPIRDFINKSKKKSAKP